MKKNKRQDRTRHNLTREQVQGKTRKVGKRGKYQKSISKLVSDQIRLEIKKRGNNG